MELQKEIDGVHEIIASKFYKPVTKFTAQIIECPQKEMGNDEESRVLLTVPKLSFTPPKLF